MKASIEEKPRWNGRHYGGACDAQCFLRTIAVSEIMLELESTA